MKRSSTYLTTVMNLLINGSKMTCEALKPDEYIAICPTDGNVYLYSKAKEPGLWTLSVNHTYSELKAKPKTKHIRSSPVIDWSKIDLSEPAQVTSQSYSVPFDLAHYN